MRQFLRALSHLSPTQKLAAAALLLVAVATWLGVCWILASYW